MELLGRELKEVVLPDPKKKKKKKERHPGAAACLVSHFSIQAQWPVLKQNHEHFGRGKPSEFLRSILSSRPVLRGVTRVV